MANATPPFIPGNKPVVTPAPVTPAPVAEVVDEVVEKKTRAPQVKYSIEEVNMVYPLVSSKSPTDIGRELGMDKKVVARIVSDAKKMLRAKAIEVSGGREKAYAIVPGRLPNTTMPDYAQPLTPAARAAEKQIAEFLTSPATVKVKGTGGPRAPREKSKDSLLRNESMASLMAAIEGSKA